MLIISLFTCALFVATATTSSAQNIRLVGGNVVNEGRVEVFHSGQWQTVCDDGWDLKDADVACRQLGYGHAIRAVTHARFGQGTGGQWEGSILCTGRERRLQDCSILILTIFQIRLRCSHSEDAGVICSTSSLQQGSLRLASSSRSTSPYAGRLEIYANGGWGTVCDHGWGNNEANVACRQMGFKGADDSDWTLRSDGSSSQTIWLDDVTCTGSESQLINCNHRGLGVEDCGHSEDIGIGCTYLLASTLPTEPVTISTSVTSSVTGIIVGVVIAAVFLFGLSCVIICIVVVCCVKRRKRAGRTARGPVTTAAGTTIAVAMGNQQPQQQQVVYQPPPNYQQQQGGYPSKLDYQQQQGGYPSKLDYQQQQGGYPPQPDYQQQQGGYQPKPDYQQQVDCPGQQPAPVSHYLQPINFSN